MMPRDIARWGPNTCGCKILEERSNPPDGRPKVYRTRAEAQIIVDAYRTATGQDRTVTTQAQADALAASLPEYAAIKIGDTIRAIMPASVVCPAHAILGHTPTLYSVVLAENQTWNGTRRIIRGFLPDLTGDEYHRATHDDADRTAYDDMRVLQVDAAVLGLTPSQVLDLQDEVDLQFGPGKVTIV